MSAYEGFLNSGSFLYNNLPYNPDMDQKIAAMDPRQVQGLQQMFDTGMDAGNFDPEKVRAIESPYTEDVVDATQNWFNNQNQIQGNDLIGSSIKSGNAFGGDRAGVAAAELGGQQQLAQAPVVAGLRQAGYTQALQEYNTLKQLGMSGAQEATQAGQAFQTQTQRELDAQRQNAVARQAYGPELTNWYASMVGGIGPLMGGSTAATGTTVGQTATNTSGVVTPPSPNPIAQGLGLATAAVGLGNSVFGGKRGGVVRRASGGGIGSYGDEDVTDDTNQDTNILVDAGKAFMSSGPFGATKVSQRPNFPQVRTPAPASQPQAYSPPTPAAASTSNNSSSSSVAGGLLGLAAKAAPLFLLHRGGAVPGLAGGGPIILPRRYATDGSVDDETDDDPFPIGGDGGTEPPPDDVADEPASLVPQMSAGAYRQDPASGEAESAGLPELAGEGGTDGQGGPSVRQIPGLGGTRVGRLPSSVPPSTVASRMATDPFLAAGIGMLRSRSPYLGAGIGEGLAGAQGAMSARAQQERMDVKARQADARRSQLDAKPQMITHGDTVQFLYPDGKLFDSGIETQAAKNRKSKEETARLHEEGLDARSARREERLDARAGSPSKTQGFLQERDANRHISSWAKEFRKGKESEVSVPEALRMATEQWNELHPNSLRPVPKTPEKPPEQEVAKKKTWGEWFRGLVPDAVPAAPATTTAAPATPAAPTGPSRTLRGYEVPVTTPAAPSVASAPAPAAPSATPAPAPAAAATKGPRDLGAALKSGQTTPAQLLEQGRAAIARNQGRRSEIIERLRRAGVDTSSLTVAPPMSQ
jgi:hypothetical protein